MQIEAIKTAKVVKGDNLFDLLDKFLPTLTEKSILAITSKIVSICEGNVRAKEQADKDKLIAEEANRYLPAENSKFGIIITIKNNILIPNAGIDESNADGFFVLWPEDAQKSAAMIGAYLKKKFHLRQLGVIITDSKTTPLRWGTSGIALATAGFSPLHDYIGEEDLFGRKMLATKANVADGLAASAVLVMGEGSEQTPMAVIKNVPFVNFCENAEMDLAIDPKDDLYGEIIENADWKRGID